MSLFAPRITWTVHEFVNAGCMVTPALRLMVNNVALPPMDREDAEAFAAEVARAISELKRAEIRSAPAPFSGIDST